MMREQLYPIIEFDAFSPNIIDPIHNVDMHTKIPLRCVISFFGEAVRNKVAEEKLPQIGRLVMETFELPIYECYAQNGEKIALIHGLGGGPYAAGQVEKLHAMGVHKYMVCGGCGVLGEGSLVGQIYVPSSAVRDEGTSYHYIEPSREVCMDEKAYSTIIRRLTEKGIRFKTVKTWTTDAMYRETVDMVAKRRQEGCFVVEMECASFFAVAQYKKDNLGQILYAGDDLSGEIWESRNWKENKSVRRELLNIAVDICSCM